MEKIRNQIMLTILWFIILFILPLAIYSQNSNCNKPERCPNKKYPYFKCDANSTVICTETPTSPPVRIPFDWPICIEYVRNSDNPGNIEMFYQPGVLWVFLEDQQTIGASLNCALNTWQCLCDKDKEPCKCTIKVRWCKDPNFFKPNPRYVFATARMAYSSDICKTACLEQSTNPVTEIVFNNTKEFHGEWKYQGKTYYQKFFYNVPENWKNLQPFQDYNPRVISFCDVLIHELGHIFGLAHYLNDNGSPMCGSENESIGIMDPYADPQRWWAFNKDNVGLSNDDKCAFMKLMCPTKLDVEFCKQSNSETDFYPNPSECNLALTFDWDKNEKVVVRLFDVLGNQYFSELISANVGKNSLFLNKSNLLAGIYIVQIKGEKKTLFVKGIIIQ